jgi:Zn-dependent protease
MVLSIPGIMIAFTFHEYAHALVADKLGDKMPRSQGRLTLNPFAHIDPIGFLLILVIGFGWTKPVETNPRAYKRFYKDDLKVSLAGLFANIIVALAFSIVLGLFIKVANTGVVGNDRLVAVLYSIIFITIKMNIIIFLLNLLPLPGLDGFHVFRDLFPAKFFKVQDKIYKYQMIILIVFIVFAADYIIGIPTKFLLNLFLKIATIVVG